MEGARGNTSAPGFRDIMWNMYMRVIIGRRKSEQTSVGMLMSPGLITAEATESWNLGFNISSITDKTN